MSTLSRAGHGRTWQGWAGQLVSRLVPTCRALPRDELHECIVTQDAPKVHEDAPALQRRRSHSGPCDCWDAGIGAQGPGVAGWLCRVQFLGSTRTVNWQQPTSSKGLLRARYAAQCIITSCTVRIVILLSSYNSIFEQFILAFDSPKGHYGASQRRYACAAPGGCQ